MSADDKYEVCEWRLQLRSGVVDALLLLLGLAACLAMGLGLTRLAARAPSAEAPPESLFIELEAADGAISQAHSDLVIAIAALEEAYSRKWELQEQGRELLGLTIWDPGDPNDDYFLSVLPRERLNHPYFPWKTEFSGGGPSNFRWAGN